MVSQCEISVALPASLVSEVPHLREKTLKIGIVARAAAIFGVKNIIVFPDVSGKDQVREINLITTILSYVETPQYLRKRLFRIRPELRYAGVLPPLRTAHHQILNRIEDLADGEYREGAVVANTREGALIEVGVERPALVRNKKIPVSTRVTVKLRKTEKLLEAEVAGSNEIEAYWGYSVTKADVPIGRFLQRNPFDLVIATSKYGEPIQEALGGLMNGLKASQEVLVVFGAPSQGLYELLKREGLNLEELADFVVNTIPRQEVETVRTEEALFVTLGILNFMLAKG